MSNLIKLNIGCRNKPLPGYTNLDIVENDLADVQDNGFILNKFEDNSLDEISFIHGLEHASNTEVIQALSVWYTKLKIGGVVRISVPDMEKCAALLLLTRKEVVSAMFYGSQRNEDPFDFHKSLHTRNSLTQDLWNAGFHDIKDWCHASTFPFNFCDTYASCYWPSPLSKKMILDNGKVIEATGILLSLNLIATK